MKKVFLLIVLFVGFYQFAEAQKAKKPTIMVIPDDDWCISRGYKITFNDPSRKINKDFPDYTKALQNEIDLNSVITQIGKMFSERGFNLKDLKAAMDKIEADKGKKATIVADKGTEVAVSPADELVQSAQADILLKITWKVTKQGPYSIVTFTIKAIDAYTSKQIAGETGTGEKSTTPEIAILLKEAVLSHVDNLQSQMQTHFDDLLANGREVSLTIVRDADSQIDLDNMYDFLTDWMDNNTVKGVYTKLSSSSTQIQYEQIRIPMFKKIGENERAIDAERFFRDMGKTIKEKYNYSVKVKMYGLGEVWLVLSDKQ